MSSPRVKSASPGPPAWVTLSDKHSSCHHGPVKGDLLLWFNPSHPRIHGVYWLGWTMEPDALEKTPVGSPADEAAEGVEIDHASEKKLVRKLDRHIIPLIMLLYLLSFLDRWVNSALPWWNELLKVETEWILVMQDYMVWRKIWV